MPDSLADRLQEALEQRGVSQSQLARQLGIDQTAISRIIARPGYQPGAFILYKIAKGLGTSVDALLDGIVDVGTPAAVSLDAAIVARFGNEIANLQKGQLALSAAIESIAKVVNAQAQPEKPARAKVRTGRS